MVKIEITTDALDSVNKVTIETTDHKCGATIHDMMQLIDQALAGMGFSDTVIQAGHEGAINE